MVLKWYYILLIVLVLVFVLLLIKPKSIKTEFEIELCENINSGRLKVVCYSMFLKNHTFCNLAADFSPYCYDSTLPLIDLNENFCGEFTDIYAQLSCFTNLAIKNKNSSMCENLRDIGLAEVCYARLTENPNIFDDINLCQKVSHESTRLTCIAMVTNNVSYCYDIVEETEEKNMCLGMMTKNISYCKIGGSGTLSKVILYNCIKYIAVSHNDIKICDNIDYQEERWRCKISLAQSIDICDDAGGSWKDFCKIEYIKNNL